MFFKRKLLDSELCLKCDKNGSFCDLQKEKEKKTIQANPTAKKNLAKLVFIYNYARWFHTGI